MSIFLMILKIILIILLSILGLVLLIVLLVLFAPFRYKLAGAFHEDIAATGKVRWLFATVHLNFVKTDGLKYKVKIFGIPIINSERKNNKNKDKNKDKKKEIENEASTSASQDDASIKDGTSVNADASIKDIDSVNKGASAKTEASVIEDKESEDKGPKDESLEELSIMPSDEELKLSKKDLKKKEKEKKKAEKLLKKEAKAQAKKDAKENDESDTEESKLDQIMAKLTKVKNTFIIKKSHIEQFLDKPYVKRTIERVKKILKKLFKQLLPRKAKGKLRYGLSSPASTGQVTGYLAMALPLYAGKLTLTPDFQEKIIDGDIMLKGRIHLGMFVVPAGITYLRKDTKKTIKLAKMI